MFLLSLFDLKSFKRINLFLECRFSITEYPEMEGTCENCWVQLLAPQGKSNEWDRKGSQGRNLLWVRNTVTLQQVSLLVLFLLLLSKLKCNNGVEILCRYTTVQWHNGKNGIFGERGRECAKDTHRFTLKITQELRKWNLHDPEIQIFYCYLQSYKVDKIGDCGFNMVL